MKLEKHRLVIAFALVSVLATTVSIVSAQDIQNEQSSATSAANARTIVGVWRTVVTPYNCQTGAPLFSLQGLFTFNEGGTMSEYGIGPGASPALRSPGHGVWQRESGRRNYSFAFTYYRYDAGGVLLGSQKVTAALKLRASDRKIATSSIIEILDVNDNVIGMACATSVGTRFE